MAVVSAPSARKKVCALVAPPIGVPGRATRALDDFLSTVAIPDETVLLLCGVPATGKSSFGRALARDHDFAHYDLECYPRGWPDQALKNIWDSDRAAFVAAVTANHRRVALDWGFPAHCLPIVMELRAAGVRLVWFDGDRSRARRAFIERGGIAVADFDRQLEGISKANFPASLNCVVVVALAANGTFLSQDEVEKTVFA